MKTKPLKSKHVSNQTHQNKAIQKHVFSSKKKLNDDKVYQPKINQTFIQMSQIINPSTANFF